MHVFRRLALGAILLFGVASTATAGLFNVVVNGIGQFNEAPLVPVIITWDAQGSNPFTTYSARYQWDSRLRVVGLSGGGIACSINGTGVEINVPPFVTSGNCQIQLAPNFPQFGVVVPVQPAFCNANGPCIPGSYQVIAPSFSPSLAVGTSFTLSGVVGGPAPTRVINVANFGDGNSVLRLTPAPQIDPPATMTNATVMSLGQSQSRDHVVSCPTTTAVLATRQIRFFHNAIHALASPATYSVTCDIRTPPDLTYDPVATTPIAIPATNALATTRTIKVTTSGGQAGGSRALSCAAIPGYSISVVTSPFLSGSAGSIRLGCRATPPVPGPANLTCTETPGVVRTWPVSCASDEAFTATPSFATPVVLTGLVGAAAPTHSFMVTNTGTESTTLAVSAPTGLSGGLSIAPSTAQAIPQGSVGVAYTITCSNLASFSGTQTLSLAHNAPGSPSQLSVTCNMRQPPTLAYSPSFGTGVQVSASVGAASRSTPINVTTIGGDVGGERTLTCTVPSNYSVAVDQSPFATGGAGAIRLGCDSINTAPGQLSCTESPGTAPTRVWNLACANNSIYGSSPRPSSAVGVYSAIGQTGFVSADVALTNSGTAPLSITGCVQAPAQLFGQSIIPNPISTTGTMNITCSTPPVGTVVFATLSCNTNDPTRPSVLYKLVCVAPPTTDPGEGASPGERLTSPAPDSGALLGSSTVIAEGPNGEEIVVVGAPNGGADGDGRVYVYVRQRAAGAAGLLADGKRADRGLGKPVATLRAPANRGKAHSKGIGNKFGEDVAISNNGTLIAVGAPTGGSSNTGEVLVFTMPPAGWDDLDDVTPVVVTPPADPGIVASDFGSVVEFSPDGMLVVGAPGAIVSSVDNAGAAFMFDTGGTSVGAPVTATTPEPGAEFGTSLDVSSGMLAVGAPGETNSTGAAYFFEIDASSTVGPANRQTATGGSFGDKWGTEVAIAGAAIVVSAPADDTAAGADSGSATVFLQGEGNAVAFAATLIPPAPVGGAATQGAGAAIATNGDVVVLGAPFSDVGGTERGRAIVYDLEAAIFGVGAPAGVYENNIGEAGDEFGSAIGISRGRLLLGAPLSDEGPDVDEGRVDPFELDRIMRGNFEF